MRKLKLLLTKKKEDAGQVNELEIFSSAGKKSPGENPQEKDLASGESNESIEVAAVHQDHMEQESAVKNDLIPGTNSREDPTVESSSAAAGGILKGLDDDAENVVLPGQGKASGHNDLQTGKISGEEDQHLGRKVHQDAGSVSPDESTGLNGSSGNITSSDSGAGPSEINGVSNANQAARATGVSVGTAPAGNAEPAGSGAVQSAAGTTAGTGSSGSSDAGSAASDASQDTGSTAADVGTTPAGNTGQPGSVASQSSAGATAGTGSSGSNDAGGAASDANQNAGSSGAGPGNTPTGNAEPAGNGTGQSAAGATAGTGSSGSSDAGSAASAANQNAGSSGAGPGNTPTGNAEPAGSGTGQSAAGSTGGTVSSGSSDAGSAASDASQNTGSTAADDGTTPAGNTVQAGNAAGQPTTGTTGTAESSGGTDPNNSATGQVSGSVAAVAAVAGVAGAAVVAGAVAGGAVLAGRKNTSGSGQGGVTGSDSQESSNTGSGISSNEGNSTSSAAGGKENAGNGITGNQVANSPSAGNPGNTWKFTQGGGPDSATEMETSPNRESSEINNPDELPGSGVTGSGGNFWSFVSRPEKEDDDGGRSSPAPVTSGGGTTSGASKRNAVGSSSNRAAYDDDEEVAVRQPAPAPDTAEPSPSGADDQPATPSPYQDAGKSSAGCASPHNHEPAAREEEEVEYELHIQLVEAVSEKKLTGKPVFFREKEGKWKVTQTNGEGCIQVGFFEEQKDIEIQLLRERYAGYEIRDSYQFQTQPENQPPQKLELQCVLLEIVQCDPHFVPSDKEDDENLEIKYNINKLKDAEVFLQVSSKFHTPGLVYEYPLKPAEKADGNNKILKWNGKTNCPEGALKDKLITPLLGPYTLTLVTRSPDMVSEPKETNVLYHSIKLKKGSYLEDPGSPPVKQGRYPTRNDDPNYEDHLKWVQYRLNELGYFAGPVNGKLTAQTKRAVMRYTYEMFGHPETDNPLDEYFLNSISGDDNKVELFEDQNIIEQKGKKSKIYIQNNYFVYTDGKSGSTNYNLIDGHHILESEKLDRFECPIEAQIFLKSRKDLTGTGDGVVAPQVLAGTGIKWTVLDPPEDLSLLPPYINNLSTTVSKSYVTQVNKRIKDRYNGRDNCPEECGGVKPTDEYFSALLDIFPVKMSDDSKLKSKKLENTVAVSKVYTADDSHKRYGQTAVLFRGSHMAGDNFIIRAEIDFDNLPNRDELLAVNNKEAIQAETGELTVWRKRRITDVIDWRPDKAPAVNWDETVESFKSAFIELDVTTFFEHRKMSEVIPAAKVRDADPYVDFIIAEWNHGVDVSSADKSTLHRADRNIAKFDPEQNYPFEMTLSSIKKYSPVEFNNLMTRVTMGRTEPDVKPSIGDFMRGIIGKTKRPGIIVVRCMIFKGHKENGVEIKADEGSSCTGTGGGGVYISERYRKELKDGFLYTHEIAHCLYLAHHHYIRPQKADDHDNTDHNCVMSYLHNDGYIPTKVTKAEFAHRMGPGGDWKAKFCGKCLLKLRGWIVNTKDRDSTTVLITKHVPTGATPCNPRMHFEAFQVVEGSYKALVNGVETDIRLEVGSKDPGNKKIPLGPLQFLHVHKLTWESSWGGPLSELADIITEELVEFQSPTQDPPFCVAADPDQKFTQAGNDGPIGQGPDDHSVMLPALICAYPRVTGKITGIQRYRYNQKVVGKNPWQDIPEAVFLLEKEVYLHPTLGIYVLSFKKLNKRDENPNHYFFEAHYKIGPPPVSKPIIIPNPTAVADPKNGLFEGKKYYLGKGFKIFEAGASKVNYEKKREKLKKGETKTPDVIKPRNVTIKELGKMGLLDPKHWPDDPRKYS